MRTHTGEVTMREDTFVVIDAAAKANKMPRGRLVEHLLIKAIRCGWLSPVDKMSPLTMLEVLRHD